MKAGDILFVRITQRVESNDIGPTDFEEHFKYLTQLMSERTLIAGGFNNVAGGMVVYSAKNFDEAKQISDNDPLIKRNLYTYELREWELAIVSDNA